MGNSMGGYGKSMPPLLCRTCRLEGWHSCSSAKRPQRANCLVPLHLGFLICQMGIMVLVSPSSLGSCDLVISVREVKTLSLTPMSGVILLLQNAISSLFPLISQKTQDVGRAGIMGPVFQMRKWELREVK